MRLAHSKEKEKCLYPKVAGEELRTSGGTYAAVPTKVHALSSAQEAHENNLSIKNIVKQFPHDNFYTT